MKAPKSKPIDGPTFEFIVRAPEELIGRLETERARRGLRSRNEVVVAILSEVAARPAKRQTQEART